MQSNILHPRKILTLLILCATCCLTFKASAQCGASSVFGDNYSTSSNWIVLGTNVLAPPNGGGAAPGSLTVSANQLRYTNFRPRQTRRLARSLGGALNGSQNQFRFEFDFTILSSNVDIGACLVCVTQNSSHPYTDISGSTTETNNNDIEVRLANPHNTFGGYYTFITSKFGTVRGPSSSGIPLSSNVHYWARLQRVNAGLATLQIYSNPARTVLVGSTCVQIDPNINGLDWVQHAGWPSTGWTRQLSLTLDNLCVDTTLVGSTCSFCPPTVSAAYALDCSTGIVTATATPSGGAGGYTYLWNTGATTATIGPLSQGTYSVTVTDATGCTAFTSVNVPANPGITANVSVQNAGCSGACNGSITVSNVTGGTPPYTYKVDGVPLPGLVFNNICPGVHTFLIEDASGCRRQYDLQVDVESGCWQQTTFNNSSVDHGNDIRHDKAGNVYVVGDYMDFTNFKCSNYGAPTATNPVSVNGDKGMYITKYSPCGEVLWTAYSQSSVAGQWANATALVVDEANHTIYVTGEFRGANLTIKGGDGASSQTPMHGYADNMYIAKFDMASGKVFWMLDYMDPTSGSYMPRGICQKGTDVYIAGQLDVFGTALSFAMKASVSGIPSVTYTTTLPDKDCYVEDIELQGTGGLVIVGRYVGQIGTGMAGSPYPIVSGGGGTLYDGFVCGLSDAGTSVIQNWIYTAKANTGDAGLYDVAIDNNDNIFVAGTVRGSTVNSFVHSGTSVSLPATNTTRSAIVARLNTSGTWSGSSWMNYSEPTTSQAIGKGIDVENGVVIVNGNHINAVPLQFYSAGANTVNGPAIPVNNTNTVWVAQMNDLGGVSALNVTEGNGVQNVEAVTCSQFFCHSTGDYNNDLIIAPATYNGGAFANTKAFTIRNLVVLPDIPFAKYTGIQDNLAQKTEDNSIDVQVYPNPATSKLFIKSTNADVRLTVYNTQGQKITGISVNRGVLQTMDISELIPGVYIMRIENTGQNIRFIKY